MILVQIICFGILSGCTSSSDNINGLYQYEETIYINPLSSYLVTKDNADEYVITDDSITIVHKDNTRERIVTIFEKRVVDQEMFNTLFQAKTSMPDISGFNERYQYSINEQYRIYVMDDEIWIAQCPNDMMWAIFKLVKIEN